jgi:aspartyl-tRNA(Asn)/glutamyl-tRNA(Gln) amidotransferase subunit A
LELHYETIASISKKLRSGGLSSTELTQLMLDRIEQHNKTLNAFITVTPDVAHDQAKKADEELRDGIDRGPLHGIPIAIKDLIATKGIRTTCGSKLFEDWIPDQNAAAVARMRESGAVLLGKTGLHELAYGNTSINPFFGPVRNPWATDHDPGGSSGGSASAVAAGLAYAALGTETGCSIRQPAHCCGIVGHKPTYGLVSLAGVQPLVPSMDHVGPLTRSVEDAALMLGILTDDEIFDFSGAALDGQRIGVVRSFFFDGYSDVIEVVDTALDKLRELGASIIELDLPDVKQAIREARATFAEAYAVHADNLEKNPESFSEELRGRLAESESIPEARYTQAQKFRRHFTESAEELLSNCDVLVAPTATIAAAPIKDRPEDYRRHGWKNTGISDFTGQPSVSIPCGFTRRGLPVGIMFTGRLHEDEKVLQIAHAIEQATDWYQTPPEFP